MTAFQDAALSSQKCLFKAFNAFATCVLFLSSCVRMLTLYTWNAMLGIYTLLLHVCLLQWAELIKHAVDAILERQAVIHSLWHQLLLLPPGPPKGEVHT